MDHKIIKGFVCEFPQARRITRKVTRLQQSRYNRPIRQRIEVRVAAGRSLCSECFAPLPPGEAACHEACTPAGVLYLHLKEGN